ncbi:MULTISPECIES: cysteine hydrolase family protein [Aeromonas]|uniref:cysteine hydrolase family protein n=1 Tax=Aeromonas TaxID=642 RepID=UPI0015DD00DF|nr:cysteine hydrolase family protein [Aeromonas media]MDM5074867.1 cysteine hydrolase [Aeromonas media]WOQ12487.1 cysteine hydrolase family protein [Aeromonas media]BBS88458.1 isochorismatase [Aeromonas media]
MDVLLIIDVQQGVMKATHHQQPQVLANINRAAAHVRQQHGRVIYIQHDDLPGGELEPGTPGWQLHPALQPAKGDSRVRKTACDSFLETELAFLLAEQSVDRLILCGSNTDFCVDTTVRSAAAHGFEVLVLQDGHTTADRPHLSAEKIIEHHNWMWRHLDLPEGRSITLLTTDQLLEAAQPALAC